MKIEYSAKTNVFFAQAYGSDSFGSQEYGGCVQTSEGCIPTTTTTAPVAGTPNTGFLGLSPDAAIASAGGALLVAIAVIGTVFVLVSRRRSRKNKTQGE